MKISFCTLSHGCLYQLRQTIRENLDVIKADGNSELVVLNYNSPDSMDWYMHRFQPEIDAGILIYAHEKTAVHFHASKAINISHLCSSGDYLVNLDGDNFIDSGIESARKIWSDRPKTVVQWFNGNGNDGTCGRIGMSREVFTMLGGYDESLPPFGGQDKDIMERAKNAGLELLVVPRVACAIKNVRDVKNTGRKMVEFESDLIATRVLILERTALGIYQVNANRKKVAVEINWKKEALV